MGVGRTISDYRDSGDRLNTFFVRYGCRPWWTDEGPEGAVSIPSSSGMGVGPTGSSGHVPVVVSIPSSSGMGVGLMTTRTTSLNHQSQYLLRQVWVSALLHHWRHQRRHVSIPSSSGMGVGRLRERGRTLPCVSIPSSSGMGVGRLVPTFPELVMSLNTFFVRYGCRPSMTGAFRSLIAVSIPSSSGMGVGQIGSAGEGSYERLNTFFVRYGCRPTAGATSASSLESQYLLRQVWVSARNRHRPGRCRFVSIPSSSGMGVGLRSHARPTIW